MIGDAGTAGPLVSVVVAFLVLGFGAYLIAVLETVFGARVAGHDLHWQAAARQPVARAALLFQRPAIVTERPDMALWVLGPALYAGLAAVALTSLPLGREWAMADVRTGIIVFGSAEVIAMVAVFLHGWSSNSPFPLVGAYRFFAAGLSVLLLSMFVLIAAALPAESMSFGRIVTSQQEGVWNLVRQPLGLPLFLVVALGVSFYGPLNFSDGDDIAGGTAAEVSGPAHLAWAWAQRAMLTVYAVATAVVFMAGASGPVLPGPVWLFLKATAVAVGLVWVRHHLGRVPLDRFVLISWTVLLPLSFLHLAIAGLVTLA